jgi:hypothetical protein
MDKYPITSSNKYKTQKEYANKIMKFPTKHQYTFPKVEVQIHPLLNLVSNSLCISEVTSLQYTKTSLDICKYIAATSKAYKGKSFADGEWKWLNDSRRINYLTALNSSDVNLLLDSYSSLFRQDASYGIVSGTYVEFCDAERGRSIMNGILCDVDTWLDYTNLPPNLYLAMPDIGRPYGVKFGENLVSPDICRHDYHAYKLFKLVEDMGHANAIIVEIGGGYGGVAYQLIKRDVSKKYLYVIIDLFETLCVQYFYLKSLGVEVEFSLGGCIEKNSSKVILVPSEMADKIDIEVDIVYNCNSFSEMAAPTIQNYFDLVNKRWVPRYIFHQNSDVLLYPNSQRHVEIVSSEFPIDIAYKEIYRTLSPWAGGSGRYREYLYERD